MKIKYIEPKELLGQRVRVYRNLTCLLLRLYSVQVYLPGSGWRVAGHVQEVFLKDVSFKVSEAGRQRVIREKSKNVHAYIYGTVINEIALKRRIEPVSYNPYECSTFFSVDKKNRVLSGDYCSISKNGVLVYR